MFSLVAIPANIFIVNSKHLQTLTNAYKILKQTFTKNSKLLTVTLGAENFHYNSSKEEDKNTPEMKQLFLFRELKSTFLCKI